MGLISDFKIVFFEDMLKRAALNVDLKNFQLTITVNSCRSGLIVNVEFFD